jgi:hypothetical protein
MFLNRGNRLCTRSLASDGLLRVHALRFKLGTVLCRLSRMGFHVRIESAFIVALFIPSPRGSHA